VKAENPIPHTKASLLDCCGCRHFVAWSLESQSSSTPSTRLAGPYDSDADIAARQKESERNPFNAILMILLISIIVGLIILGIWAGDML